MNPFFRINLDNKAYALELRFNWNGPKCILHTYEPELKKRVGDISDRPDRMLSLAGKNIPQWDNLVSLETALAVESMLNEEMIQYISRFGDKYKWLDRVGQKQTTDLINKQLKNMGVKQRIVDNSGEFRLNLNVINKDRIEVWVLFFTSGPLLTAIEDTPPWECKFFTENRDLVVWTNKQEPLKCYENLVAFWELCQKWHEL